MYTMHVIEIIVSRILFVAINAFYGCDCECAV